MEKRENFSNAPAGATEIGKMAALTQVLSITTKTIQKDLIYNFDFIPDSVGPSRVQKPVVIKKEKQCACIDNYDLVLASTEPEIDVIEIQIDDTSDAGIGLFKTRWRMAGLGGDLNCAERARNISILYKMFSDKDGLVVHGLGGDRRSDSFSEKDGLTIREFIAAQLDKSEQTIRTNLHLIRHYSTEVMNELAKKGASKRQMAYLSRRRTEFMKDYLNPDWSDERIEQEVSKRVIAEWLRQYDPNTEKQRVKLNEAISTETGESSEKIAPPEAEAEKAEDQIKEVQEEESKGQNLEKPDPEPTQPEPITGFAATLMKKRQNPEVDEDEDEPQGTPSDDLADEEVPDYKEMFPNLNHKASIADKQSRVIELGNDLIRVGQEEPDPETFSAEITKIVTELMKLLQTDSKAFVTPNTQAVEGN